MIVLVREVTGWGEGEGGTLRASEHARAQGSEDHTTLREALTGVHGFAARSSRHYLDTGTCRRFDHSNLNTNQVHQAIQVKVVSRGGLEPPTRCLRGSCSTIE